MGNTHSDTMLPQHTTAPHKLVGSADTTLACPVKAYSPSSLSHSSVFGGNTTWHKAAKAGNVELLDTMKQQLSQALEVPSTANSSSAQCSVSGHACNVTAIMKQIINKPNKRHLTPLMLACAGAHTAAAGWLIRHGADVWKHGSIRNRTALHCAAQAGATNIVQLLLADAGSDVHPNNQKTLLEQGNYAGLTALHYAVCWGHLDVLQQLLSHDADITAQAQCFDLDWQGIHVPRPGDTVMHIAANQGNEEIVQIVLQAYEQRSSAIVATAHHPRRVHDPRVIRNYCGLLPCDLAMRQGLTSLAELLNPSALPWYSAEGPRVNATTTWGPPRLATIAAAVLHNSLVTDLANIQDKLQDLEKISSTAASIHCMCDETTGEDNRTCGVCLDVESTACIRPCHHSMCTGCALDMLKHCSLKTAVCPFCRCIIRGFDPINLATVCSTSNLDTPIKL